MFYEWKISTMRTFAAAIAICFLQSCTESSPSTRPIANKKAKPAAKGAEDSSDGDMDAKGNTKGGSNSSKDPNSADDEGETNKPGTSSDSGTKEDQDTSDNSDQDSDAGSDTDSDNPPPANNEPVPEEAKTGFALVKPILEKKCVECHHPGASLDLSALPFANKWNWSLNEAAKMVLQASRGPSARMPPGGVRDGLTDQEAATLSQWVDSL